MNIRCRDKKSFISSKITSQSTVALQNIKIKWYIYSHTYSWLFVKNVCECLVTLREFVAVETLILDTLYLSVYVFIVTCYTYVHLVLKYNVQDD